MTYCAYCGEWLAADADWRLRPEIEPGTLETEGDDDFDHDYMHADCRDEYVAEQDAGAA